MNQTVNLPRQTIQMEEPKARLSTLWTFLLFNMVFADIFSFMHPGALKQIMAGNVEGTTITPEFLLIAAVVTEIPMAMVLLSRLLKYGVASRIGWWSKARINGGTIREKTGLGQSAGARPLSCARRQAHS